MVLLILRPIVYDTSGVLDFLSLSEHHQDFPLAVVNRFQVEPMSVSGNQGIYD